MPSNRIELTDDGSHSIFSERFEALYHSKHGAIQESKHIFINSGLNFYPKNEDQINILEMGFGTGLNLLLTLINSEKTQKKIHFETVEAYPISHKHSRSLNYVDLLNRPDLSEAFVDIHVSEWNRTHQLNQQFSYKKHHLKLQDSHFTNLFDIVYYDAFAPDCQEELWTAEIFEHIARYLKPSAILVSYCAKGDFKRALIAAGFTIEKIPGPPGKREMIRATYRG